MSLPRPRLFLGACLGALLAVLGACTTTEIGQAVELGVVLAEKDPERAAQYRGATQSIVGSVAPITPEAERTLGEGVALGALERIGPAAPDEALQRYVNLVGQAVARNSPRPGAEWTFAVLQDDAPNAFAGPGGYVFITTGALALMEDEAELAGVLAHEVAHVTEEHLLQTYRRANLFGGLQQAMQATRGAEQHAKLVQFGNDTLFERGLDQRFEHDADAVGTEIAWASGYDPMGLANFLEKLSRVQSRDGWLSTHPSTADRIGRLRQLVVNEMGSPGGVRAPERFRAATGGLAR